MEQVLVRVAGRQLEWLTDHFKEDNLQYVSRWDNHFFLFKLQAIESAAHQHPNMAFLAARQLYVEMLECFCARLCAGMQAGYAFPLWLLEYSNSELKSCVSTLLSGGSLENSGGTPPESLMDFIAQTSSNLNLPEEDVRTIFTRLLADFDDPYVGREYNSIKHANRAVSTHHHRRAERGTVSFTHAVHFQGKWCLDLHDVPPRQGQKSKVRVLESLIMGSAFQAPFVQTRGCLLALQVLLNIHRTLLGLPILEEVNPQDWQDMAGQLGLPENRSQLLVESPALEVQGKTLINPELLTRLKPSGEQET